MTARIEHPSGLQPPEEWLQTGRTTATEFREWLAMDKPKQKQRSKFGAWAGYYADLDMHLRSLLEANTIRWLTFTGFERWKDRKANPPAEGKWFAYERKRFKFTLKPGTDAERTLNYLPDLQVWDNGQYRIVEVKGFLDPRSKRLLRLMGEHYPEIKVDVVTVSVLEGLALEAMREDRRHNGSGRIPHWDEGPTAKEDA